jgi:hypothetical protein
MRAFQKHMTHPPFVATEKFRSQQKGPSKKISIAIGLAIKNSHKIGDYNSFLVAISNGVIQMSMKSFLHPF